ncbi:enolase-like protein [Aliiruegeria haliotis]|uniref:Enolase-like protein n=1 Tax=Aliiruegeria haliotis TaxID=1280846 RepID=A0A2T0RMQ8_9RHOB|nr:enolase C-terminal domain-like protein [Aliiruegeria haliotis]PRY22474.1 enolase-like protein [Aliiruegeria haliotis]
MLALFHFHFTPVINHDWGSAVAVATNLQLLATVPPLPEFDTTENRFRDGLLADPLDIQGQMARKGRVDIPTGPGLGVEPDRDFIARYEVA